jgi:hypothetical protein
MKTSFHLLAATLAFVIAAVSVIGPTSSVSAQDPAVVQSKTVKVKFEN